MCTLTVLVTMTVRSDELDEDAEGHVYSNSWAVKVTGGVDVADRIAEKHGFKNLGQVSGASTNGLIVNRSILLPLFTPSGWQPVGILPFRPRIFSETVRP